MLSIADVLRFFAILSLQLFAAGDAVGITSGAAWRAAYCCFAAQQKLTPARPVFAHLLQVMLWASHLALRGGLHWRRPAKWAASKCCWVSVGSSVCL
jgi:hypothetical protein